MQKILQSLKNLYVGEGVVKNHLNYVFLLLLPSVMLSVINYVDKDMPKNLMIIFLIVTLFLVLLSIIPMIFCFGLGVDFYRDRLSDKLGFPEVTKATFLKGLKLIPLVVTWCSYFLIIGVSFVVLPIIPMFFASGFKDNVVVILLYGLFILLYYFLLFVLTVLIVPFIGYVMIDYSKDCVYKAKYFNPFIIVDYVKKSFKDTLLVTLKFFVVGLVAQFATGFVTFLIAAIIFGFLFAMALVLPEKQAETVAYNPVAILFAIPLSAIAVLITNYVISMVNFAAAENYVAIFKEKLAE